MKTLAGTTGLEPATSCVTGMRSDQLNYVPDEIDSVSHSFTEPIDSLKNLELPFSLAIPAAPGIRVAMNQWSVDPMTQ